MTNRPNIVKRAFALGIIGGVVAFIAMIDTFALETEAIVGTCVNMLVAVLFFAVAGAFRTHGPGGWGTVVFMATIATASAIGATVFGSLNIWFGAVLTVIGLVIVFIAANAKTGRWIQTDRLVW